MQIKLIFTVLLILAYAAVAVADVFLRKASDFTNVADIFKSPWIIGAIALYIFQIFVFIYLFFTGAQLINVGIVQIVLYALIIIGSSVLLFHETVTPAQTIGIVFGVVGVILINL
jgi:drug/metabolite transporter (DMT)-like permease